MKRIVLLFLSFLFLLSCSRETFEPDTQIGTWIGEQLTQDTLVFHDASNLTMNGVNYTYSIEGDSMSFEYNGAYFIYCLPQTQNFNYNTSTDKLMIENLGSICMMPGIQGENYFHRDK